MDTDTASEFPRYADGDVLIIVTPLKRFQLHASVLRRNSVTFEHMLAPRAAAQLSARARKEGVTILYQLELDKTRGGIGRFRLNELDSSGRAVRSSALSLFETTNGRVPDDEEKFWTWLFAIFYNIDPEIDETSLSSTLNDCVGLIDAAESIGSVQVTRRYTDLALSRHNTVLASSIAGNPAAWVDLGYRLHSPNIFRDAVIHLVGKWNTLSSDDKHNLRPVIRELCQRKFEELDIAKQAIEMRILGHYPPTMTRNAEDKPGRPSYMVDIYIWMALCFFRQWFAQAISDGRNRVAVDGGCAFYRSIASGEYLDKVSLRNFHQYFPMSGKACGIFETNMKAIKEDVKKFVKELVVDRTTTANTNTKHDWLTCVIVAPEDYPWSNKNSNVGQPLYPGLDLPIRQNSAAIASGSSPGSDSALHLPDNSMEIGDDP